MHYQKIDIDGIYFDGIDREKDYEICFPVAPSGQSVLDIGCNVGFYCLKAAHQGALFCLGIDNHQEFLDVATDAKNQLGFTNVDFMKKDVLNETLDFGEFDITLCLNLVHHFRNITFVEFLVQKLYKYTKKKLIFEVLECTEGESWAVIQNRKGNPKIHLSEIFFRQLFPADNITSVKSEVTEGRIFVIIEKEDNYGFSIQSV